MSAWSDQLNKSVSILINFSSGRKQFTVKINSLNINLHLHYNYNWSVSGKYSVMVLPDSEINSPPHPPHPFLPDLSSSAPGRWVHCDPLPPLPLHQHTPPSLQIIDDFLIERSHPPTASWPLILSKVQLVSPLFQLKYFILPHWVLARKAKTAQRPEHNACLEYVMSREYFQSDTARSESQRFRFMINRQS